MPDQDKCPKCGAERVSTFYLGVRPWHFACGSTSATDAFIEDRECLRRQLAREKAISKAAQCAIVERFVRVIQSVDIDLSNYGLAKDSYSRTLLREAVETARTALELANQKGEANG